MQAGQEELSGLLRSCRQRYPHSASHARGTEVRRFALTVRLATSMFGGQRPERSRGSRVLTVEAEAIGHWIPAVRSTDRFTKPPVHFHTLVALS